VSQPHGENETVVEFRTGLRSHLARLPDEPDSAPVADDPPPAPVPPVAAEVAAEPPADGFVPEPAPAVEPVAPPTVESREDRLWRVVEAALDATTPSGTPDHAVRLNAATLLLSEGPRPTPPIDEIAALRERRAIARMFDAG
jgi:hypothetical protein